MQTLTMSLRQMYFILLFCLNFVLILHRTRRKELAWKYFCKVKCSYCVCLSLTALTGLFAVDCGLSRTVSQHDAWDTWLLFGTASIEYHLNVCDSALVGLILLTVVVDNSIPSLPNRGVHCYWFSFLTYGMTPSYISHELVDTVILHCVVFSCYFEYIPVNSCMSAIRLKLRQPRCTLFKWHDPLGFLVATVLLTHFPPRPIVLSLTKTSALNIN